MSSLNCKGVRERSLHKQLEKYYNRIWWVSFVSVDFHRIYITFPSLVSFHTMLTWLKAISMLTWLRFYFLSAFSSWLVRFFPFLLYVYSSELQKSSKDLVHKVAQDDSMVRRSTRVWAPPRENPSKAFVKYANDTLRRVSDLRWFLTFW